jgi:hypothetical protein
MKKLRALSIKQPFAERVMRGTKKFEYRSRPTSIREHGHMYANLKPRPAAERVGLKLGSADVPLGLIVRTVEIAGCKRLRVGEYA